MDHLKLTPEILSVNAISDLVTHASCGAVSIFVGTTRDNFENKKVLRLEYEAYEAMAIKAMKSICDEIRSTWPAIHGIAIYHRTGVVPIKEASIVIAISSPHRKESLEAVSFAIDKLKATVPIWKKEIYDGDEEDGVWKENKECNETTYTEKKPTMDTEKNVNKTLVQINVSNSELEQRINNFMERKREQVNMSNIQDFITNSNVVEEGEKDIETCARVRTLFVRRNDSKGHLKVRRVNNEWGPQTAHHRIKSEKETRDLPLGISERVTNIENFLNINPVSPEIYKRLKDMEDKIAYMQSISPEYADFWKRTPGYDMAKIKNEKKSDYVYGVDDISRKIEELEKQGILDSKRY